MPTPEEQSFISALRFRMIPGAENPPTLDEMKKAIGILRDSRSKTIATVTASGAKSKAKTPPTAQALASALDELDSM